MVVQTLEDNDKEMALLPQCEEQAQEAIHSQQSEHQTRS
jgi:hypothetical protein